jgi:ribosomal protein S18 acetylase RimI-like enzyme
VDENFRGRGFGSALLQYVIEQVRAARARKLYIDTSSDLKYNPAIRLYERFGFHKEASLGDYYGDGEDFVILSKALRNADGQQTG